MVASTYRIDPRERQSVQLRQALHVSDVEIVKMAAVPLALVEPLPGTRRGHSPEYQGDSMLQRGYEGKIDERKAPGLADARDLAEGMEGIEQVLDDHHRDDHILRGALDREVRIQVRCQVVEGNRSLVC